ncbi:unnamed protein product, partial [Effrenium voratum]
RKIDALVRKGGIAETDAPDDPLSVRFWASTGGEFNDRRKTTQTGEARFNVAATSAGVASLVGGVDPAAAPTSTNQPSLTDLVSAMNGAEENNA